jgi:hypothetical protein
VTLRRVRVPNLVLTLSRELLDYSQQDLADRLTDEAAKLGDYHTVCDVRMVRRWEVATWSGRKKGTASCWSGCLASPSRSWGLCAGGPGPRWGGRW